MKFFLPSLSLWDLGVKDVPLVLPRGRTFRKGVLRVLFWPAAETRTSSLSLSSFSVVWSPDGVLQTAHGGSPAVVIDSWTASSQGANLLLPVWAASGTSPSLAKLPEGIQVLDLAEKPRSRHMVGRFHAPSLSRALLSIPESSRSLAQHCPRTARVWLTQRGSVNSTCRGISHPQARGDSRGLQPIHKNGEP